MRFFKVLLGHHTWKLNKEIDELTFFGIFLSSLWVSFNGFFSEVSSWISKGAGGFIELESVSLLFIRFVCRVYILSSIYVIF